jgi:hypothetical protein
MKIKVGELRGLISEALDASQPGNFKPGDWVVLQKQGPGDRRGGKAVEIVRMEPHGHYSMCVIKTADGTSSQRADIMLQGARPATPEEIQKSQGDLDKEQAWMAKTIDSGRQGT